MLAASMAESFGEVLHDLDSTIWHLLSNTASQHPGREAVVSMWQPDPRRSRDTGAGASSDRDNDGIPPPPPPMDAGGSGGDFRCARLTYADMYMFSGTIARWCQSLVAERSAACEAPSRRLAAYLWNSTEWALWFWAAARLGMAFVPLDPRSLVDSPQHLGIIKPHVLVVQDADIAQKIDHHVHPEATAAIVKIQCHGDACQGWTPVVAFARQDDDHAPSLPRQQDSATPRPSDTALIVFTSGTTSTPKACPHTHRNLISATHDYDPHLDRSHVDRWLVHTPGSHMFALNHALRAWRVGSAVVLPSKSFDIGATVRALKDEQCTIMSAVPPLIKALAAHPTFPGRDKLALHIIAVSATMIQVRDLEACRQSLGARDAIQSYGMSEGAPVISWNRQDPMLADGLHEGAGKVLPGANVRICHPDTRAVLPRGEVGELHIGGSTVIAGYLEPQSTDFYHDQSGNWMATGDQAMMDSDGVIRILGRYKDLLIRAGENVSPVRLETHLCQLPGLVANVVGVPDDTAGQVPVAVVILPQGLSKADVFAKSQELGLKFALAGVVHLKEELGLDAFPSTALGKVKKHVLQKLVIDFMTKSKGKGPGIDARPLLKNESIDMVLSRQSGAPRSDDAARTPITPPESPTGFAESQEAPPVPMAASPEPPSPLVNAADSPPTDLEAKLAEIWTDIAGVTPKPNDSIATFADSITILRFCDRVLTETGRQLYLQDLLSHDTVAAQAALLVERENSTPSSRHASRPARVPRRPASSSQYHPWQAHGQCSTSHTTAPPPQAMPAAAGKHRENAITSCVLDVGGSVNDIEDVVAIREVMWRLASGLRPQSYHTRLVFRSERPPSAIRAALMAELVNKPMMRTLLILDEARQASPCHVVMRPSSWLFGKLIQEVTVADSDAAAKMTRDSSAVDHVSPFMFRAVIIQSDASVGSTLISLTYNHSIMDAMSLLQWHAELDRLICADDPNSVYTPPLTSYKHFTDLLNLNSGNGIAQTVTDFHVRRLRGISRCSNSLWPAQRAPGWMIGNDQGSTLAGERALIREQVWQGRWAREAAHFEFPRSCRILTLPHVERLRQKHSVQPSLLAKSALVLFNVLETKTNYAIFNSWESGRRWPFVPDWMTEMLPPAASIDAPTVEWVVNMIEVNRNLTVMEFFGAMRQDQDILSANAHAPWGKVLEGLHEEAQVALDASYRQGFVWDVSIRMTKEGPGRLEPVARYDWPDCGIFWNAFMLTRENMEIFASWDTAQMDDGELEENLDAYARVIHVMAEPGNWDRTLEELFWP